MHLFKTVHNLSKHTTSEWSADTVDHFHSFALDTVIAELRTVEPDFVELFQQLVKGDRFEDDDELSQIVQMVYNSAMHSAQGPLCEGAWTPTFLLLYARRTGCK